MATMYNYQGLMGLGVSETVKTGSAGAVPTSALVPIDIDGGPLAPDSLLAPPEGVTSPSKGIFAEAADALGEAKWIVLAGVGLVLVIIFLPEIKSLTAGMRSRQ